METKNDFRQIYEVPEILDSDKMPTGTKFKLFEDDRDLIPGTELVAKSPKGWVRGKMISVVAKGIVNIGGINVLINNVLYTIV